MPLFSIVKATARMFELMEPHRVSGHGPEHLMNVYENGVRALEGCGEEEVPSYTREAIKLACLLHDTDDPKLFRSSDYANARKILEESKISSRKDTQEMIALIIEMIGFVSCSKNGNTLVEPRWKLIPRDADRVEALGIEGIRRCCEYTISQGNPLFTEKTPRMTTREELYRIATPERFAEYQRTHASESAIDHHFDKLLHISQMTSGNVYLQQIASERHKEIEDFVIRFGMTGKVDF